MGRRNLALEFRQTAANRAKLFYLEVLGNRGWTFDWHNSRLPHSHLTPPVPKNLGAQTRPQITAKRQAYIYSKTLN